MEYNSNMKNKLKKLLFVLLIIGNVFFFLLWVTTPTEQSMKDQITSEIEAKKIIEEDAIYDPEEWKDPNFKYSDSLECEVAVAFMGEKPINKSSISFSNLDTKLVEANYRGEKATFRVDNETKDRIWLIASSSSGYTDITSIDKVTGEITSSYASAVENMLSSSRGYCKSKI